MTAITRSFLSAAALLLEYDKICSCESEDELRTIFMGAFLHSREAHLSLILMPEAKPPAGFNKKLDLDLLPSWPPKEEAVAVGEMKFFPKKVATNYRTRIGGRLSDIHYVHSLADSKRHGFFFDLVLNTELVGQKGYNSLKKMCKIAADALYDPINPVPPEELKNIKGIKAFATACIDHTPRKCRRKMQYGFLFPPMDLPGGAKRAKRGPAFVRSPNEEGFISIGVRKAGKEQTVPYRAVKINGKVDGAVCFAVFEPGGKLAVNTDDLVNTLATR